MKSLKLFSAESLFLSLISLGKMKQGIRNSICFLLAISDLKIVSREYLGASDLPVLQVFNIDELGTIVIISENKDFKFATIQAVTLSLEHFNNA